MQGTLHLEPGELTKDISKTSIRIVQMGGILLLGICGEIEPAVMKPLPRSAEQQERMPHPLGTLNPWGRPMKNPWILFQVASAPVLVPFSKPGDGRSVPLPRLLSINCICLSNKKIDESFKKRKTPRSLANMTIPVVSDIVATARAPGPLQENPACILCRSGHQQVRQSRLNVPS